VGYNIKGLAAFRKERPACSGRHVRLRAVTGARGASALCPTSALARRDAAWPALCHAPYCLNECIYANPRVLTTVLVGGKVCSCSCPCRKQPAKPRAHKPQLARLALGENLSAHGPPALLLLLLLYNRKKVLSALYPLPAETLDVRRLIAGPCQNDMHTFEPSTITAWGGKV
jgi:hypothetical protein